MIKKSLFCLLMFIFLLPCIKASSCNVSVSNKSVTVGSSVKITISGSDVTGNFTASSSNNNVLSLSSGGSVWIENGSDSVTFTAKSVGSATITTTPGSGLSNSSGDVIDVSCNSITINVVNQTTNNTTTNKNTTTTTPKTLSSINYLTSLSVSGSPLSPEFDKNTTEYEVTLESGTTSVNISGDKESSSSYVTGLGEVNVSEGVNYLNVVVTAENGAKRTYVIKATVLEEEPIIINVDGNDLTLIRTSEALPNVSEYYTSSEVLINDIKIPCYINDITSDTLVALKDDNGVINLYRYVNDNYILYKEFGFNALRISLLEPDTVLKDYSTTTLNINDIEVTAYIKDGSYPLIYGKNIETGEISYYTFDEYENTIQRFQIIEEDNNNYYLYIIIGLIGLSILEFVIMIIVSVLKNKKLKKILSDKLSTKTDYESSLDNSDFSNVEPRKRKTDDSCDEMYKL